MDKSEYHKYLASREWALLKKQVRERSGGKCERCMTGRHEATHHLTYERIGHELLSDLLGLCQACHRFLSGESGVDPAAALVPARRAPYPEPVFIYPITYIDFWWGTISDPEVMATRALGACIENIASELISITETEDILWEGDVKVGVVPDDRHPCTAYWAGRSLQYRLAKQKNLGFATIIASYMHMAWISRNPIVMAARLGSSDGDWEVYHLKELDGEDALAIQDSLVNLDLKQND